MTDGKEERKEIMYVCVRTPAAARNTEVYGGRSDRRPSESMVHTPSGHTFAVKKSVKEKRDTEKKVRL